MTSRTTDEDLLATFDMRMRAAAEPDEPGARVEHADGVVRLVGAQPCDGGGVVFSDLDARTADAAIQAQIAYFLALGADFEWKHYSHDEPADLPARLTAAGFEAGDPETLFVAEITHLEAAGLSVSLPDGITLRPVTTEADADLVAEATEAAFGAGDGRGDRARARVLARLADDPKTVWTWLAMAGDRPVSAARMLVHSGTGFASLWGGGTAPDWRGRGIYRALVARRMEVAVGLGCEYLQVDASDMSRPILERLGFRALSVTTPYEYRF